MKAILSPVPLVDPKKVALLEQIEREILAIAPLVGARPEEAYQWAKANMQVAETVGDDAVMMRCAQQLADSALHCPHPHVAEAYRALRLAEAKAEALYKPLDAQEIRAKLQPLEGQAILQEVANSLPRVAGG